MKVGLAEIGLSDGHTIEVPETGLLVIVGPNNAGKSALLRETWQHLLDAYNNQPVAPVVVPRIQVIKEAQSDDDLRQWFEEHTYAQVQRTHKASFVSAQRTERFVGRPPRRVLQRA
jgi:ABC-type phosphate/phosphonate transport system ATPase subunit